jgi:DNA-binding transcriptional LysR family regulator
MQNIFYKNNRLQQLRGFVNVVQEGGVSKAAHKMCITQPAISKYIKSLEDALGVELFKKHSSNFNAMEITKEGQIFYDLAIKHLQGLESVFSKFHKIISNDVNLTIKIAAHDVVRKFMLPSEIQQLIDKMPNCLVIVKNTNLAHSVDLLIQDEIDVAIFPCEDTTILKPEIEAMRISKYEIQAVCVKNHPITKLPIESLSIASFLQYNLLFECKKLMSSNVLSNAFYNDKNDIAAKSNILFDFATWDDIYQFTKQGLGIAGFDSLYLKQKNLEEDGLVSIPIGHLLPDMSYYALYKSKTVKKKSLDLFLEYLQNEIHIEE